MRALMLFVAGCMAAVTATAVQPAMRGQLCIAGKCRPYTCNEAVAATDETRPFTLKLESRNAYLLGLLRPGHTRVACGGYGQVELRLNAVNLPRKSDVTVSFGTPDGAVVAIDLQQAQLTSPITLFLAPGQYEMLIDSIGYSKISRKVTVAQATEIVTARLVQWPKISGMVWDHATARGVAGAAIAAGDDQRTVSDASGRFEMTVDPDAWPSTISVSAGGYVGTSVRVPAARVSTVLEPIQLARGGSIVINLNEQTVGDVEAVDLHRATDRGRPAGPPIKSLTLQADRSSAALRFTGLEPGRYVVVARGDEATERFAEGVEVKEGGEAPVTLDIAPFTILMRVEAAGAAFVPSRVLLAHTDAHWETSITTDTEGEASVTLWQGGPLKANVEAPPAMPYIERHLVQDETDSPWVLRIPTYEITGVVVDSATGSPVPEAAVALRMIMNDGNGLSVSAKADDKGRFRFWPVAHGQHTIKAAARGYPPMEMTYSFREPEESRSLTLVLDAATTVPLTVTDAHGAPVMEARVLTFAGLKSVGLGATDPTGVVSILVPENESRDVYVIPRDGSLAFTQVNARTQNPRLRVHDGNCRIVLRTESSAHEPIPNVSVVVRYNGKILPLEVLESMAAVRGGRMKTGLDGQIAFDHMPAGVYEFWPVGSADEFRALAAGGGPPPPVRIVAAAGETVGVMTFAAVKP